MRAVPDAVWSALTSLYLAIKASNDAQFGLFEMVARMPQLGECCISNGDEEHELIGDFDQFAEAAVSLFDGHQARTSKLTLSYCDLHMDVSGCDVIDLVRLLQQNHTQLQFNMGLGRTFEFTLGNVTLNCGARVAHCDDECPECCSFHPNVIAALCIRARDTLTNGHLEEHQIDRCKAGRVVQDHNMITGLQHAVVGPQ